MPHEPQVVRIPTGLNCSRSAYAALGLEELGPAPSGFPGEPERLYCLVRLPVGWTYKLEGSLGRIIDDRGIVVAITDDNHKGHDRQAWTKVVDVGRNAAGCLCGPDASLLEVHFELLTDSEVASMLRELARIASEPYEGFADAAKEAAHWQSVLRGALAARMLYRGQGSIDFNGLGELGDESVEDLIEELERVALLPAAPAGMSTNARRWLAALGLHFTRPAPP